MIRPTRPAVAITIAATLTAYPAPLSVAGVGNDRVSDAYVDWFIDESSFSPVDLSAKLGAPIRVSDFEFVPGLVDPPNPPVGLPLFSKLVDTYYSVDIENVGIYSEPSFQRFGPGVPSVVVQAMIDQGYRPIDIEVRPAATEGSSSVPARMLAIAVPNTGANRADWFIELEQWPSDISAIANLSSPRFRPIDIEYSGDFTIGQFFFRGYAVLAVENEPTAATGYRDWRMQWTVSDFALTFEAAQPIGKIVDLEAHEFRLDGNQNSDNTERYDAILVDWEGETPHPQLANVAAGELGEAFAGRIDDERDKIPHLSAGFRIVDAEYFWLSPGPDEHCNAVIRDAPTGLQRRVRDALADAAFEGPLQSRDYSALDIKEIGGERFPGVHSDATTSGGDVGTSRHEPPAMFGVIAAYAYAFDDIALTEQQLNTCDIDICPTPPGICDPQNFTVEQLVDRMLNLQDYAAAQTLIEERYTYSAVFDLLADSTPPVDGPFAAEDLCGQSIPLPTLTDFTEAIADGSIVNGQAQADLLSTIFVDDATLNTAVGLIIDDEALETDLTQTEIDAFKDALRIGSRTYTRPETLFTPTAPQTTPTLRVLSTTIASIPGCHPDGVAANRHFAVTALVQTAALNENATEAAVAESLRDAIADALDGWDVCAGEPCTADTNNDQTVGLDDLLTVLSNFGSTTPNGQTDGDIDPPTAPDGTVGLGDLLLVLANFGNTCP